MRKVFFIILFGFFLGVLNVYAIDDGISSLKINGVEKLAESVYSYTANLNSSALELKATLISEESTATLTKDGSSVSISCTGTSCTYTDSLSEGETYNFVLKITSGEENRNYVITITREEDPVIIKSSDNTLKKLLINDETITLKEGVKTYSYNAMYGAKTLKIDATATDNAASFVESFGPRSVGFTTSTLKVLVKVMAENGEISTYTINVTRKDEPDTTLKKLAIKNIEFNYSKSKQEYEIKVPNEISSITFDYEATDKDAKVTITGNNSLKVGKNEVQIKVSKDLVETIYTIIVTREADISSTNLKTLKIKGYDLDFSKDKTSYTLKIKDEKKLEIEAVAEDDDAEVKITGNSYLENGSIIKIRVVLDDGTTKIYRLTISKEEGEADSSNKIIIISVIAGILIVLTVLLIIEIKKIKRKKKYLRD